MKRVVAGPDGSYEVDLTPEEEKQRLQDIEIAEYDYARLQKLEDRKDALAEVWPDPFSLIDDILKRGPEAVAEERTAIKSANPKE